MTRTVELLRFLTRSCGGTAERRHYHHVGAVTLGVKRLVDVVGAGVLLLLLLPLLCLVAVLVKLTSPGPVIYAGLRHGHRGCTFPCYKFRSMRTDDAEVRRCGDLVTLGDDGRPLLHARDPRVTPLGRWLRASSIDELPQLINVLRGEMSLIGPRPLVMSMLAAFPEFNAARSVMRPGITGLWQVRARRKNVGALDMMPDDLAYIDSYSLILDFKIAFLTLGRLTMPELR